MQVILHNIRSVHNVGSIFRTADALGSIEKIYLCGITPTPVNEIGTYRIDFAKTALGAEQTMPWEKKKSTTALIKKLRSQKRHTKIIAAEQAKGSVPYYRYRLKGGGLEDIVLLLGDEVKGLPPSMLNQANTILEIPMAGKKESLNVSIAFAVVAFSLKYTI